MATAAVNAVVGVSREESGRLLDARPRLRTLSYGYGIPLAEVSFPHVQPSLLVDGVQAFIALQVHEKDFAELRQILPKQVVRGRP